MFSDEGAVFYPEELSLLGMVMDQVMQSLPANLRTPYNRTAIARNILACALTGNFLQMFVCRIIQGIGVGGEMPVAATYINELSRAHGRGRFFLLYELIFPIGFLAAAVAGAQLVPVYGWNILFLIGTVPGLIITYLVSRLPESPRDRPPVSAVMPWYSSYSA